MAASLLGTTGQTSLGTASVSIGRSIGNQLVLNDMQVSAHHAIIRLEGQKYIILDIGSTNGTYVNNQRIDRNTPRSLSNGDVIRVGQTILTFENSEVTAPPLDFVYSRSELEQIRTQQYAGAITRPCPRCSSAVRETAQFCHVCGYDLGVLNRSRQGIQIGNYIVDRFLGSGGIGAVYLAHHRLLKQSVALKIHDYFHTNPYVSRAFLRSSNYLSQLDHPNIVHLYDYGLQDEKAYQAIEYINGPTFAQIHYQKTQEWIYRCIEYFMQMLAALNYAHNCTYIDVDGVLGKGIIHGDIKPQKESLLAVSRAAPRCSGYFKSIVIGKITM